jgi:CheY-like chemotaxis protein
MPELRISTEKVCALMEAGRELGGRSQTAASIQTGAGAVDDDTGGDDGLLQTLDAVPNDPTRQQIVEMIAGLNVAEQADLLALLFVGRGDYGIEAWDEAVAEATDRLAAGDPDYLVGDMGMPEYLADGLEAFGRACEE